MAYEEDVRRFIANMKNQSEEERTGAEKLGVPTRGVRRESFER